MKMLGTGKHSKTSRLILWLLAGVLLCPLQSLRAAGELVTINYDADDFSKVVADSSNTAVNGYTFRIGIFGVGESTVSANGYNLEYLNSQFTQFGSSDLTANNGFSDGTVAGSTTSTNDAFKGQQAYFVISDNATLTSASQYGVYWTPTTTNSAWQIPNSALWDTDLSSFDVDTTAFGSFDGDSINTAAKATSLYWDSSGTTWSNSHTTNTSWAANSSDSGTYAWGADSGSIKGGAGLKATFDEADTVTISGTVSVHKGIDVTANTTFNSGTIDLASATKTDNTITISAGVAVTGNSTVTASAGGEIVINNGGSYLLGASNLLADGIDVTLNQGTFKIDTDVTAETLGILEVNGDSVLDFNTGSGATLTFSDYNLVSGTLSIWNWSGTKFTGGGSDQLIFTSSLSTVELQSLRFYSDGGTTLINQGPEWSRQLGTNEVVAAPEPATWVGLFSILGFGLLYQIRRRKTEPKQG